MGLALAQRPPLPDAREAAPARPTAATSKGPGSGPARADPAPPPASEAGAAPWSLDTPFFAEWGEDEEEECSPKVGDAPTRQTGGPRIPGEVPRTSAHLADPPWTGWPREM